MLSSRPIRYAVLLFSLALLSPATHATTGELLGFGDLVHGEDAPPPAEVWIQPEDTRFPSELPPSPPYTPPPAYSPPPPPPEVAVLEPPPPPPVVEDVPHVSTGHELFRRPEAAFAPEPEPAPSGRNRGSKIGEGVGTVAGFVGGAALGGYAGFLAGGALGALLIPTPLAPLAPVVAFGGTVLGAAVGSSVGAPVGAAVGGWLGSVAGKIGSWLGSPAS